MSFDNLKDGTRRRLATHKRYAQRIAHGIASRDAQRKGEPSPRLEDMPADEWRRWRYITPHGLGFAAPSASCQRGELYGRRVIFMDSGALEHLRAASDDLPRDFPTQWYTDADCGETCEGHVTALPRGRFIAWISWTGQDGITVLADTFESARDAAYSVDRFAERCGEEEREYSERWRQASAKSDEREEAREDLAANRAHAHGLILVLRSTVQTPESRATICGYIRDSRERMRAAIETIRDCADSIHDLDMQGEF